ncbi:hypothetical protein [Pantoea ananatis]|uniref:hypothetical protein n=1 Tax=Pantoea ananas TaxID=553 RepID=UPI000AC4D4CE|nr:hypothetical protein [Pantoea ananatis]UYL00859.1 hypothetical protein NG830_16750 [Pantoea ananatis]
MSAIFYDLFKENKKFYLNGNDLLNNYYAPEIGSGDQNYLMMRDTGLSLAGKINYSFFSSQNDEILKKSLLNSAYYQGLQAEFQNI